MDDHCERSFILIFIWFQALFKEDTLMQRRLLGVCSSRAFLFAGFPFLWLCYSLSSTTPLYRSDSSARAVIFSQIRLQTAGKPVYT